MFNEEKIPFVKPIKSISNLKQTEDCKKRKLSLFEDDECDSHREFTKRKPNKCFKFSNETKQSFDLNEKSLWTISNEYETLNDWKPLGKLLGLSDQDILLIEHKYPNDLLECFYQCLLKWRLRQPENCNWNFLSKIISQKFNKSITSTKSSQVQSYLDPLLQSKLLHENLKLNEKLLWYASDFMCENWKSIGRYLGLRESTLTQIESKYLLFEGLRECCYQMLLVWSEQFYSDAYLETFCTKLIEMKFNYYVKELLEYF